MKLVGNSQCWCAPGTAGGTWPAPGGGRFRAGHLSAQGYTRFRQQCILSQCVPLWCQHPAYAASECRFPAGGCNPAVRFDLIAKLVIDAGFMVNLLNHDLLPVRHLRQVRIPAFALAQQFEQGVALPFTKTVSGIKARSLWVNHQRKTALLPWYGTLLQCPFASLREGLLFPFFQVHNGFAPDATSSARSACLRPFASRYSFSLVDKAMFKALSYP